jgi:hypothetical protein
MNDLFHGDRKRSDCYINNFTFHDANLGEVLVNIKQKTTPSVTGNTIPAEKANDAKSTGHIRSTDYVIVLRVFRLIHGRVDGHGRFG